MMLRDSCGHPVIIAVWGEDGPVVVRWDHGSHALPINVRVGAKLPMLASSSGVVFLDYLPPPMKVADGAAANHGRCRAELSPGPEYAVSGGRGGFLAGRRPMSVPSR